MSLLDSDQKGYIDFKDFQKNFSPNMSTHLTVAKMQFPSLPIARDKVYEVNEMAKSQKDVFVKTKATFEEDMNFYAKPI